MRILSQNPQLLQIRIFCCPEEGCRKKLASLRDLNIHLKMKHKSNYKIELASGSIAITKHR